MIGKLLLACVASFAIIVFGMPHIEQSRQEARDTQAFILAQQIKSGSLPKDTVDPWGNPFNINRTDNDELVVVSRGSNMVTPAVGYDDDDISTSMTDPPHKKDMRHKRIQLFGTLALAALPWLIILFSAVRRQLVPQQQTRRLPQPQP